MNYSSKRVHFDNGRGHQLAGIVDSPVAGPAQYSALFSHCFTCTKDLKAIARISRQLAGNGIETLRFDFTGLGGSGGEFAETDFLTTVADVTAASQWMAENLSAPSLLIGHSLGGAAMVVAASGIQSARCIVNIASPSTTAHLAGFLSRSSPEIESAGSGAVVIGGRPHTITRRMVGVLRDHDHRQALAGLTLPLLVMFSPADETLPFEQGREMFRLAGGPTSFISLDGADHLLVSRPEDLDYVSNCIALWSSRYCAA